MKSKRDHARIGFASETTWIGSCSITGLLLLPDAICTIAGFHQGGLGIFIYSLG